MRAVHPRPGRSRSSAGPAHAALRRARILVALVCLTPALAPVGRAQRGELMDEVVLALERSFYDRDFRRDTLPALGVEFRARAREAQSLDDEKRLVTELLGRIPVSHLALYSATTHDAMMDELMGRKAPTFGFQLVELKGQYFVDNVFEKGVAARADLRRGDRVLEIDGLPPARSPRLDWTSDDAALPDPPVHALLCEEGDELTLEVERSPAGTTLTIELVAELDSGFEAMRRSARIFDADGVRIAYVHLWFIHHRRQASFLRRLLGGAFDRCDALILDLRGRGGSAAEALRIVRLFGPRAAWKKPVVALVDRGTRSAKEAIADEFRRAGTAFLVGERTPGALIPATFERVGEDMVLMYPTSTLGERTQRVEGIGVPVDFEARYELAYTAGRDEILRIGLRVARAWVLEVRPLTRSTRDT